MIGPWKVLSALAIVCGVALETASELAASFDVPRELNVSLVVLGGASVLAERLTASRRAAARRERYIRHRVRWYGPTLPRVRDIDPYRVGVTPSTLAERLSTAADGSQPPYVRRDIDAELDEALRADRFVVVTGRSKVGKSRSAIEAAQRIYPDAQVIVPASPGALQEILELDPPFEVEANETTVLWLDDLDDYLEAGALDIGLLEAILGPQQGTLILATIRSGSLSRLRAGEAEGGRATRDLLLLAREVVLREASDSWDGEDAEAFYPATDFESAGIGAFFAAVEELKARYEAGQDRSPAGEAAVRAAVDWRRAGLVRAIPRGALEELISLQLEGAAPGTIDFDGAIAWANEPVSSSVRLLTFVGGRSAGGFRAADPIIEYDDLMRPVPPHVWEFVLRNAERNEILDVAQASYLRGERGVNESALLRAVTSTDARDSTIAAFNLGVVASEKGDLDQAERWYREAEAGGHPRADSALGQVARARGNLDEAELRFRRAASGGDVVAAWMLASLLADRNDDEEAEEWFRQVVAARFLPGINDYGVFLLQRDRTDEAERILSELADSGWLPGLYVYGVLLATQERAAEAEQVFRRLANAGDERAEVALGKLLAQSGRIDEAERWLRAAARRGGADELFALGFFLGEQDSHSEEAVALLTAAADAGSAEAAAQLGFIAHRDGDLESAERWLERSVAGGEGIAAGNLGALYALRGEGERAESLLRKGAEAGHGESPYWLGTILIERGDVEAGVHWLEAAAKEGPQTARAANQLGILAIEAGDWASAEKWFTDAAGDLPDAQMNLARGLVEQGRPEEATPWLESLASEGDAEAMFALGAVRADSGRLRDAEVWFRRAVDAGVEEANKSLAAVLLAQEKNSEAKEILGDLAGGGDPVAAAELARTRGVFACNPEEAERLLFAAAVSGDAHSAYNLARFLRSFDRLFEAELWYRVAADRGDPNALVSLGVMLGQLGRVDEAEGWFHEAIGAGQTHAMMNLGNLLHRAGRNREAEELLRNALDADVPGAALNLSSLLRDTGREAEAEELLRGFASRGDSYAALGLGLLLRARGDEREAAKWFKRLDRMPESAPLGTEMTGWMRLPGGEAGDDAEGEPHA